MNFVKQLVMNSPDADMPRPLKKSRRSIEMGFMKKSRVGTFMAVMVSLSTCSFHAENRRSGGKKFVTRVHEIHPSTGKKTGSSFSNLTIDGPWRQLYKR